MTGIQTNQPLVPGDGLCRLGLLQPSQHGDSDVVFVEKLALGQIGLNGLDFLLEPVSLHPAQTLVEYLARAQLLRLEVTLLSLQELVVEIVCMAEADPQLELILRHALQQ